MSYYSITENKKTIIWNLSLTHVHDDNFFVRPCKHDISTGIPFTDEFKEHTKKNLDHAYTKNPRIKNTVVIIDETTENLLNDKTRFEDKFHGVQFLTGINLLDYDKYDQGKLMAVFATLRSETEQQLLSNFSF